MGTTGTTAVASAAAAWRRELVDPGPWTVSAACRGQTHLFFAHHNERPSRARLREAAAKHLCQRCPVLEPCRAWAREHAEQGIWGGETEDERRRLRRARRGAGATPAPWSPEG